MKLVECAVREKEKKARNGARQSGGSGARSLGSGP